MRSRSKIKTRLSPATGLHGMCNVLNDGTIAIEHTFT